MYYVLYVKEIFLYRVLCENALKSAEGPGISGLSRGPVKRLSVEVPLKISVFIIILFTKTRF